VRRVLEDAGYDMDEAPAVLAKPFTADQLLAAVARARKDAQP
jgi:hypothetical protein